ncbi:transcriptional regulator [Skermania sp. ID1734]|uniref:transcriptional regulator n=1 Tax=Skermania sp. ID1734 TaxID=2597516 RepID=UPI00117F9B59|nr:transcriptional regulator [Skermania sp. ID1734]TSD94469.1 transcriptional regulator [Skermania sp. ID1734]
MTQVTWRAPDALVERLRRVASREGKSLNEYLTLLASAATDPSYASNDADRLRERLAQAGLLAGPESPRQRPAIQSVAQARKSAGAGTPLSDYVHSGRE